MFFGGMPGGGFPGMGVPQKREPADTTKLYETLGIEKSSSAAQIKKAYRKKALRMHPDKGCLLYTSPSPRDATLSRMPSSA